MAVVATKEIKKKRMLIIVLSVLVAGTLAILYYGGIFGKKNAAVSLEPLPADQAPVENSSQKPSSEFFELKIGIFEDEQFKNLQKIQVQTQASTTLGKLNPFSD